MSSLWRPLPRALRIHLPKHQIRLISDSRPFTEGDLVLLREKLNRSAQPILTFPLKAGKHIHSHKGVLSHDSIIGKRVRDVVETAPLKTSGKAGAEFRLHEVRLEEYVRLTRRLVTPVYPGDASLIVSLLDLHPEVYDRDASHEEQPRLEILEAGTGHGALTLYLSRAIHAANPPISRASSDQNDEAHEKALDAWKNTRKAIIHTLDISPKYSSHASSIVKGFKQGLYHANIDFHVADLGSWVRQHLASRNGAAFLSHAILDLPNADAHLSIVAEALRTDGCLVVFNPSITQIMDCAKRIRDEGVQLELDKVIELGVNGGSGGREWDVRPVRPRKASATALEASDGQAAEAITNSEGSGDEGRELEQQEARTRGSDGEGWSMVCRPRVGERIVGGGFLGVWRKQRDMSTGAVGGRDD